MIHASYRLRIVLGPAADDLEFMFEQQSDAVRHGIKRGFAPLATQIAAYQSTMRADMAAFQNAMRADMAAFQSEMRADMAAFQSEMRADMAAFQSEMRLELRDAIAEVRIEIHRSQVMLLRWLAPFFAGQVVAIAALALR